MTKEQIMSKMDKIYTKLELYVKKNEMMGLEKEEEKKYYMLFADYLKLKLRLGDKVFDQYVLPALIYGDAAKLKLDMLKQIKWTTELMIDEEQMEPVIKQYSKIKDKTDINNNIENYYVELMMNLETYLTNKDNEQLIKEISKLLTDGQDNDSDVLRDHMDYKFEVLYMILAEGE